MTDFDNDQINVLPAERCKSVNKLFRESGLDCSFKEFLSIYDRQKSQEQLNAGGGITNGISSLFSKSEPEPTTNNAMATNSTMPAALPGAKAGKYFFGIPTYILWAGGGIIAIAVIVVIVRKKK